MRFQTDTRALARILEPRRSRSPPSPSRSSSATPATRTPLTGQAHADNGGSGYGLCLRSAVNQWGSYSLPRAKRAGRPAALVRAGGRHRSCDQVSGGGLVRAGPAPQATRSSRLREVLADPAQLAADEPVPVPPSAYHFGTQIAEPIPGQHGWSSFPFVLDLPCLLVHLVGALKTEVHPRVVCELDHPVGASVVSQHQH